MTFPAQVRTAVDGVISVATVRLTMFVVLTLASHGQSVLHSGEGIFTVSFQGGYGARFKGQYLLAGESVPRKLEGVVPTEIKIIGTDFHLTVQNQTSGKVPEMRVGLDDRRVIDMDAPNALAGNYLEVVVTKDGRPIKKQRTDAPYGIISFGTEPPSTTGAPINTQLQIEGVRFALVTCTVASGDTEQQLVPVPFSKQFYPREGSIVSMVAQKVRVVRDDPLHPGLLEILDNGKDGTMTTTIRVNGAIVGSAEASEPFGVASVAIKVP
jgi:hypothetical protein